MELINQTKTVFKLGKEGEFKINEVRDFKKPLADTLLRYEGINSLDSLKAKAEASFPAAVNPKSELDLLKEEATELGIEFAGNISKAKLIGLVEAKKAEVSAE